MPSKPFDRTPSPENEELAQTIAKYGNVHKAYAKLFPEIDNVGADFRMRLHSGTFKYRLSELLDRQGLSLLDAGNILKKQLNGKRPIILNDDLVYVDDNATQLEAVKTIYKLHGVLSNTPSVMVDNRSVEFNMTAEDFKNLSCIAKELDELNNKLDLNKHKVNVEVVDTVGIQL